MTVTKEQFIDATLGEGMLMFGKSPFFLKSGRASKLFFNAGNADSGTMVEMLEEVFADLMEQDAGDKPVVCFGLPYKCINVASHAAAGLCKRGRKARWNSYRKEEKDHGGDAKSILVARGTNIQDCGGRVGLVDDVITTAASKHEGMEVLEQLAREDGFKLDVLGVYLLVDRQEVTSTNVAESAVKQFEQATGLKVKSFITAAELIEAGRKKGLVDDEQYRFALIYFRVYGSPEVFELYRSQIPPEVLVQPFFTSGRSIVPACDFNDLELFAHLAEALADVEKVGGFKAGSMLVEEHGLGKVLETAKKHAPKKPVIYDRQKGGTDIPEVVYKQVEQYAAHGYDAHIVFPPMTGPETMLAAINAGYQCGIKIILGADMTHMGFDRAEGGCITMEDSARFYKIAALKGLRNFVMPGTKPDRIAFYRKMLADSGVDPISIWSPGLVTQGGNISEGGNAAGPRFQGIVGRAIYEKAPGVFRTPDEMRAEVLKMTVRL